MRTWPIEGLRDVDTRVDERAREMAVEQRAKAARVVDAFTGGDSGVVREMLGLVDA